MVYLLENTVQPYAWGSPTAIPKLFGLPNPSGEPVAEIWMGAHPKAPSHLVIEERRVSLAQHIAQDPIGVLGEEVARRYGGRLPFLFKVLAAAEPLSIQAHPNLEQARSGFAREEAAGVPRDAPNRNYRDDNHKPELIFAVTPFWGLRGFRSPGEIRHEFESGGVMPPDGLHLPRDDSDLVDFVRSLMLLPQSAKENLVASALSVATDRWSDPEKHPEPGDALARYFWLLRLAGKYPGDVGVMAPLFLNVFSLKPGEATYQPAGVLHAYLEGTGMELMANSDNVLRGGLTPKHMDLDELLSVGVFRTESPQITTGHRAQSDMESDRCPVLEYPAPFEEFAFSRVDVPTRCNLDTGGPQILFCSTGKVTVQSGSESVKFGQGASVFVQAGEDALEARGHGTILRATVGRAPE